MRMFDPFRGIGLIPSSEIAWSKRYLQGILITTLVQITSTFIGQKKDDETSYLFFLLTEDYIQTHRRIKEDLEPLLTKFARSLEKGLLVRPFEGDEGTTQEDVFSKNWTIEQRTQIERTPGILVIDVNFDEFDPQSNHWHFFSFRDLMSSYGDVSIFEVVDLLSALSLNCNGGKNLFELADSIARRRLLSDLYRSFEVKPGIFGISFDVKKGAELLKRMLTMK